MLRLAVLLSGGAATSSGQTVATPSRAATLTLDVSSDTENFLRYLQTLGEVPLNPWGVRPFGPREVEVLLATSPRGALRSFEHPVHHVEALAWQVAPAIGELSYNTSFPFGLNDGPVWRGRGLTAVLQGGIAARYGPLSVTLRPSLFWAQNQEFDLMPNGEPGLLQFSDALNPRTIDRPQRFGDEQYARIDPGQSTIRLDAFGLALGVSTANMWWGPMSEWPYILGNNAPGFLHVFAGSARPWNVGVGRIHGRVLYGRLSQTAYTDIVGLESRRLGAGLIGSFTPRGMDNLEIGVARFFHQPWPAAGFGWRDLRKPFEAFLKEDVEGDPDLVSNSSADNQLVSFYARWLFPRSGIEIYGEFGREDHSWDARDVTLAPDHESTLGLGIRKAWRRSDGAVSGIRAELLDLDPSNLARNRGERFKYTHGGTRQGHTERGQLLGAGFAADAGAASMLAFERYFLNGEKSLVSLTRMVVRERDATGTVAGAVDAQYALTAEHTRRVGRVGVTYGLTGVYELNRYFGGDASNVLGSIRLAW